MTDAIQIFGGNPDSTFIRGDTLKGVTVTLGAHNGLPINTGLQIDHGDTRVQFFGGSRAAWGAAYPLSLFDTTYSLHDSATVIDGSGGKLEFRTNAQSFDLRVYGNGVNGQFSLFVDGKLAEIVNPILPPDGSLRWLHFDLSQSNAALGWKKIQIEFRAGVNFGGLVLDTGSAIEQVTNDGPRIVFLGDSITETGAAASPGEDWPSIVARQLGVQDAWQSGLGGTGYARPLAQRQALVDRIETDGILANADAYVIAIGIADRADVYEAARSTFSKLVTALPGAKVIVLTSWNPSGIPNDATALVDDSIKRAAAEFHQVSVIDVSRLAYELNDGPHPSATGSWTIANWVTNALKSLLQIDGSVRRLVDGETVGPLFIENFNPAADYTFQVFDNGIASNNYTVIETGDAFPVLKLVDNFSIDDRAGTHTVRVLASAGGTVLNESTVTFNITAGPSFRLFASDGHAFGVGAYGSIVGTNGFQDVSLLAGPGEITLDASFSAGNDIVRLPGNAGTYDVRRSGSNAIFTNGELEVTVPVGTAGLPVVFDDGTRVLRFDTASSTVKIGTQTITSTAADMTAAAQSVSLPTGGNPAAKGKIFLTDELTVPISGDFSVVGTTGRQTVQVKSGDVTFDPSFSVGNDIVQLDAPSSQIMARRSGSNVILHWADGSATLPVGTSGMELDTSSASYNLRFNAATSQVLIGSQVIGSIDGILTGGAVIG